MKFFKFGVFAAAATAALIISASAAVDPIVSGGTVTTKNTSLNFRSEPNVSASVIGSANNGDNVIVLDMDGDWFEVYYAGKTGYMSRQYVTTKDVEGSLGKGYIDGENVNVRAAASTESESLGLFSTGKTVDIIGCQGTWYKITDGTTTGFMDSVYVSLEEVKPDLGSGTVSGSNVRLREAPNTSCGIISTYNSGKVFEILEDCGDWYKVTDGSVTGYIHASYLSRPGETTRSLAPAANLSAGEKIVACAKQYLGVPYVYGGTSPYGFDCSGMVHYVYRENGYSITRRASTIWYDGTPIDKSELQVGDCVFFSNDYSSSIEHVGIYIGGGQFIHASSGGGCVRINNLSDSYYLRNWYGACRIL